MACIICEPCDIMSGMHNVCMMHGTHAPYNNGVSMHLSGLVCTPADSNLEKTTASHFQVLNDQNANENMPNMIPIVYLNKNLVESNENLTWGKRESLIHSYVDWYAAKGEKAAKTSFYIYFMQRS